VQVLQIDSHFLLRARLCGEIQFELWWKLVFGVLFLREEDPPKTAISMNLDPQSLRIGRTIRFSGELREIELDVVPTVLEPERHRADIGLDPRFGLKVGSSESPANVLVVEYLDFE